MDINRSGSAASSVTGEDRMVVLVRLCDVIVAVRTSLALVRETVTSFYPVTSSGVPEWTVTAVGAPPPPGVTRTRYDVGVHVDVLSREVRVWSLSPSDLAVTVRKCVREVFLLACEQAGYTMLHASAIYTEDRVVVFAADKRGGKTTLALRAVLEHGWRWLSNDHLILLSDGRGGLAATSLPTPIPVKAGTLVDLWDHMPAPWDLNGFDIEAWRRVPPEQRYAADDAAYYTFAGFGQSNPVLVPLDERRIHVVFPRYASLDYPAAAPVPVDAATLVGELGRHVRTDWTDNDTLNQRYLPVARRDAGVFAADGARLVGRLADLASGWRSIHRGDPGPLLDALAESVR